MAKKKIDTKSTETKAKKTLAERQKMLKNITDNMNKKAGEMIVGFASDKEMKEKLTITYIPFPSHRVNAAIGGGLPIGKITQITGEQDSGKTVGLLELIADEQKRNPDFIAAWLETENSLNDDHFELFGIDRSRFLVIPYEDGGAGEECVEQIRAFISSNAVDMVVINSIKALIPSAEFSKDLKTQSIGTHARFVSRVVGILNPLISKNKVALVIVNHLTTEIGKMHGDPLVTASGRALKYYSMLTLDYRKKSILENDPIIGKKEDFMKVGVSVRKNHCMVVRNPYVKCDFFVEYGKGTDKVGEIIEVAIKSNILSQVGAWIREYDKDGEERILPDGTKARWNGIKAFKKYVIETPDYLKYPESKIHGNIEVEDMSDEEVKDITDQENMGRDFLEAIDNEDITDEELGKILAGE